MVVPNPSLMSVLGLNAMVSWSKLILGTMVVMLYMTNAFVAPDSLARNSHLFFRSPNKGKHQVCTISSDNTPTCACKSGYIQHDHYGCVDENPPLLQIRPYPGHASNDNSITRLTQGDRYEEHGVDIIDDNAEDYLRSLKIDYSRPVPQGCLLEMGQFDVNYTGKYFQIIWCHWRLICG